MFVLDTRRKPLITWPLLAATVAVAIVNGRPFSPYFDPMLYWLGKLVGRAYQASPIVFHASSIAITILTLLLAAVPALLARKALGRDSIVPRLVWLAVATAASWPTLRVVFGASDH